MDTPKAFSRAALFSCVDLNSRANEQSHAEKASDDALWNRMNYDCPDDVTFLGET